ncbi:MAG: sugar phosphate isomerase/epimerase [Candidatus Pacearchaeota archaeon]|nr:sugar phosphate isomerase/epimerase [Candidatus Pacearchaeota archaeon]
MAYEFFYSGKPYSLDPNYGELFTGYRIPFSEIGAPTSIQTANQIGEVSNLLNQGGRTFELQPIQAETFDQIPKQHFKEINRLLKLTNADTSIHAPMIDPAGFTQQGWDEAGRMEAERQISSIVERAHELKPDGNILVNIHASATPGTEYSRPDKKMLDDYKMQIEREEGRQPTVEELKRLEESQIIAVNQETGQLVPIKREGKYYPESGYVIKVPEEEIKVVNNSEWINSITNLAFYKKEADEILRPAATELAPFLAEGKFDEEQMKNHGRAIQNMDRAKMFLDNVETSFRTLYSKAYKYGDASTRKVLENIQKSWQEAAGEQQKLYQDAVKNGGMDPSSHLKLIIKKSALIDDTLTKLNHGIPEEKLRISAPDTYVKIEDFAKKQSAETLANAALNSYQKFKNNAPIISIENLYPGMAFSKSDELRALVEKVKDTFVEKATAKGISESQARAAAEKMIGVTWDVGHLNILKKGGYTDEDIKKETEKISSLVKHVHLTDNFGYGDSHLSPGMGNVPFKQIMETLEKAGFSGKKIIEAGSFVQHFKQTPTSYVLESFGSPLYSIKAPYWNQMPAYGNYLAFPTGYFPEQHFSLYGGGFASIPTELGGQMPGKGSRVSGTSMD